MNIKCYIKKILFIFFLILSLKGFSQFYNGSQLTFGKNRIQFEDRFWSFLRFKRYDVYYYKEGKPLAEYTARYADKEISEMERTLEYTLDNKIQFIIYNKYSDLKQSNIGLTDENLYNTGGVTHIVGTKVFVYFDGDHKKLEQQIKYGIAYLIVNEIIYGESYLTRIKNSTLISFPDWYLEGLLAYISTDWNADIENKVKDGIMSGRFKKFNNLQGQDAIIAGHSIWKYIEIKYGASKIPNLLYLAKINRNVETGFQYDLGISFKTLIKDWYAFYHDVKYLPESKETQTASGDTAKTKSKIINNKSKIENDVLLKRIKKTRVYSQLKLDPAGDYAAYTTNEMGQYKIWLYNINKKKSKRIFKREHKLDEKVDYSYPLLAWHPSGKILSFFIEAKGKTWLYFYSLDNRKFEKRPVYLFEKVLDFSYNDKGDKFVMSVVQKGHSDIAVYNIASNTFEPITKDNYDDFTPRFINNSKDIIFSSNRNNDTLKFDSKSEIINQESEIINNNDIFIYHYNTKSNILTRVTNTPDANEIQPEQYDKQHITYLSDENGIFNRYVAKLDSGVSFVDTIVHYRHFVTSFPVTNYFYNINFQNFTPSINKYSEIIHSNGVDKMYVKDITPVGSLKPAELKNYSSNKPVEHPKKSSVIPKSKILNQKSEIINQKSEIKSDSGYIYLQPKNKHKGFTDVYTKPATPDTTKNKSNLSPNPNLNPNPNPNPIRDTNKIDINNYSFSNKAANKKKFQTINSKISVNDSTNNNPNPNPIIIPRAMNAGKEFSVSQVVTQIDFSYLNYSYQPFTGGSSPIYINSGFAPFIQLGATDLFEDFRIVGGVRVNTDLINNEYFVSFANLQDRLDRELIFHRTGDESSNGNYDVRTHTNEALYRITYPFSQVNSIRFTGTIREDRYIYMAVDSESLKIPIVNKFWAGLKAEYTFDNTRDKGLNLYYGTRYKLFAEFYRQINSNLNHDLFVVGLDFRHYIKISRTFIWANRLAASASMGTDKLIYYLGGVDGWVNPSFDANNQVSPHQNYVFQTVATPMRGFEQNIRNGSNFAVFNSELRFPVIKYFAQRPLKSDFFNNLQINAFADVGTAWNGISPYSNQNALYTTVYSNPFNPVVVTIMNQRDPIVEGWGFGLRSRLFGYFIRADYAWGLVDGVINKPIFYLSLNLDF